MLGLTQNFIIKYHNACFSGLQNYIGDIHNQAFEGISTIKPLKSICPK